MLFGEIGLVRLNAKMFVDFLFPHIKESPKFFYSGIFNEIIFVFKLSSVFGIISHEKFSQINAWVKSCFNTIINFSFLLFRIC